jgi:hypothetical protein
MAGRRASDWTTIGREAQPVLPIMVASERQGQVPKVARKQDTDQARRALLRLTLFTSGPLRA